MKRKRGTRENWFEMWPGKFEFPCGSSYQGLLYSRPPQS